MKTLLKDRRCILAFTSKCFCRLCVLARGQQPSVYTDILATIFYHDLKTELNRSVYPGWNKPVRCTSCRAAYNSDRFHLCPSCGEQQVIREYPEWVRDYAVYSNTNQW